MNNKDVTFIRVKGRVIPIKRKNPADESKSLAKQSAGFTASGIALSAGAGKISNMVESRAKFSVSRAMDKEFFSSKVIDFGRVAKAEKRSKRLYKFSKNIPLLAQLGGGALISQGFQRALRATGVEITNPVLDVAAEAGSQLASFLIARSIRRKLRIGK